MDRPELRLPKRRRSPITVPCQRTKMSWGQVATVSVSLLVVFGWATNAADLERMRLEASTCVVSTEAEEGR